MPDGCVVVQSDRTLLVEVDHPAYPAARDALAHFAEMVKSPEHVHTYRITPLSLWNAAAAGVTVETILDTLTEYGKWELPSNLRADIVDYVGRYGRTKLEKRDDELWLTSTDDLLITEIEHHKQIQP